MSLYPEPTNIWESIEYSGLGITIAESTWMFPTLETLHVIFLVTVLGTIFVVDLRMLGLAFANVPATKIAERLDKPMLIGFAIMFITGILLFSAIPVRTTQSLWFRIKVILLIAAAINAWLFRGYLLASKSSWDLEAVAPRRARIAPLGGVINQIPGPLS